jgi:hypothetical protein
MLFPGMVQRLKCETIPATTSVVLSAPSSLSSNPFPVSGSLASAKKENISLLFFSIRAYRSFSMRFTNLMNTFRAAIASGKSF